MPASSRRVAALLALSLTLAACTDPLAAGPADTAAADIPVDTAVVPLDAADVPLDVAAEILEDIAPDLPPLEDLPPPDDVPADTPAEPDLPPGIPCQTAADCPQADLPPCTVHACGLSGFCALVQAPDALPCEDGDTCTVNDSCKAGKCVPGPSGCNCAADADCAGFDDANACNGTFFCNLAKTPSQCELNPASVVKCVPIFGNPCLQSFCDPVDGACDVTPVDGAVCEDGYGCTVGDKCDAGKCQPGTSTCECQKSADCADDGDLCNGVPYCDKSEFPYTCQINPGTVVTCAKTNDSACAVNTCDATTGACALQPVNDGGACNDGDPCTTGDVCQAGACQPGAYTCGCQNDGDCQKLEDANLCNGSLFCNKEQVPPQCQLNPATVVVCPTLQDTDCAKNTCAPETGKCALVFAADGKACSDDNPCTNDDACAGGECQAKTNVCPCSNDAGCAAKDDQDLCNGQLFCNKGKLPYVCEVNPATVVSCPSVDDTTCSQNQCQKATGQCAQTPVANGVPCDGDGNACTVGDVCQQGACVPGPNNCPCQKDADCAAQEDGNVCNGTLYCDKASNSCKVNPNTVVVCPSGGDTACSVNTCQPATGKCAYKAVSQGLPCNADGNPCTTGDACDLGQCVAGTNTCQCTSDSQCAPFEDGNLCNGKLYCDKAQAPFSCKVNPATVVTCGAGNPGPCQDYACQPKTGKCANQAEPDNTGCEDGKLCTVGDTCEGGVCQPGSNLCACYGDGDCLAKEDGDWCNGTLFCDKSQVPFSCKVNPATVVQCPAGGGACLQSQCLPASGQCKVLAGNEGGACDDGNVCTGNDVCAIGQCQGEPLACQDDDACTVSLCDAVDGCLHVVNGVQACDDGNACTADSCDAKTGCKSVPADGGPCDDGSDCTAADQCVGGTCQGQAGGCDDGNPCTDDACAADGKGCGHVANTAPCSEGRFCLGGVCGGCQAFRRTVRHGCDELRSWPYPAELPENCKLPNQLAPEAWEHATVRSDGRLVAVGGASVDTSNATLGWGVAYEPDGRKVWEKTYGKPGSDRLRGVVATAANGVVAVGEAVDDKGVLRPWLLRLAADGLVQAAVIVPHDDAKTAPTKGRFDAVALLADGGALAVGAVDSPGGTSADALAARFDVAGQLLWQKRFGVQLGSETPQTERFWAVRRTADGAGVLVAGERGHAKQPALGQQGWLLRLDLAGELVWSHDAGGPGHDALYGVELGPGGSVVVVGSKGKAGLQGQDLPWLLRLQVQGKLVSQAAELLPAILGDGQLRDVVRTVAGAWVAVGHSAVTWPAGSPHGPAYDRGNGLVVALDAAGKLAWQRQIDGDGVERLHGAGALPDGDVVVAGETRDVASNGTTSDKPDGLLLRLNAKGQDLCECPFVHASQTAPGGSRWQGGVRTPDDDLVTAGWRVEADGKANGWLQRMHGDQVVWQQPVGGGGEDRLFGLERDGVAYPAGGGKPGTQGGVLAVGESDSAGLGKLDGWLVRYRDDGTAVGQASIGGADDDHLHRLTPMPTAKGGFVAVGWTRSGAKGGDDGWVVRLGPVDGSGKPPAVLWQKVLAPAVKDPTKANDQLRAVVAVGTGQDRKILAGGHTFQTGGFIASTWYVVLDDDGNVLANELFQNAAHDLVHDGARLPDGGAILAGFSGDNIFGKGYSLRFDATGALVGNYLAYGTNRSDFAAVVALHDGGWIASGTSSTNPGTLVGRPWSVRYAADGKVVWSQHYNNAEVEAKSHQADSVAMADGSLRLVGSLAVDGKHQAWVSGQHPAEGENRYEATCSDPGSCGFRGCDRAYGCVAANQAVGCSDNDSCTLQDQCADGKCQDWVANDCDDGNPCTLDACNVSSGCFHKAGADGGVCAEGKVCQGGSCGACPTASFTLGGTDHQAPEDAAALADGGLLLAGHTRKNAGGAKNHGWVARIGADDQLAWQTTVPPASGDGFLRSVLPQADGGALVAGWQDLGSNKMDAWLVRVDAQGVVQSQAKPGTASRRRLFGLTDLGGGKALFAGDHGYQGWLGELDAQGGVVWETLVGASVHNGSGLHHAVPLGDGGVLAVGWHADWQPDPWIVRFDAQHQKVWDKVFPLTNYQGWLRRVRVGADGLYTAVGAKQEAGPNLMDAWVLRFDDKGQVLWQYLSAVAHYQDGMDARVLADGSTLLASRADVGLNNLNGVLVRLDANGKAQWQQAPAAAVTQSFWALAPTPGGLYTAVGSAVLGGPAVTEAWLVRFGPDGQVFCGQP